MPGDRSSHVRPTPKGGGVGMVLAFAAVAVARDVPMHVWLPHCALAVLSFANDLRGIAPDRRLAAQILSAAVALGGAWWFGSVSWSGLLLLPAVLFVVGTTNCFNFMDGINGIAGICGVTAMSGLTAYGVMVGARLSARPEVAEDRSSEGGDATGLLDVVMLRMSRSGDVADVSSKAREMFGLAPELLLNNGLFERVHVADRIAYLSAIADMRGGAQRRRCEVRVRLPRRDGEGSHDTHGLFAIDFGQAQDAEHLLAAIRDIGDVAALRAALAAARDAGDGGEVAKAKFLAVVSHELRTPLNAIIGFSDMLLHGLCGALEDPKQREYVGLIQESGTHLLSVVNAILDVSKIESGTYDVSPEPFDFAEAVEICHSMLALQAHEKGVAIETRLADDVGAIVADRRSVRQILINLMANAVKFTPQGGRVTVAARRAGGRLHFSVGDTGIGMSETDLLRVGEPFIQVQNDFTRQFDGTGLGLSLVKGLVKLHRGTMTIESAPESGTTVSISLPVDGPGAAEQPGGDVISLRAIQERSDRDGTFRKIA